MEDAGLTRPFLPRSLPKTFVQAEQPPRLHFHFQFRRGMRLPRLLLCTRWQGVQRPGSGCLRKHHSSLGHAEPQMSGHASLMAAGAQAGIGPAQAQRQGP